MAFRASAQRQSLVKVSNIDGYWLTKTGGNKSADTTKVYDGGNPNPDVIASPPTAENVTVSRAFDKDRDNELLVRLRQQVGRRRETVSITPTDEDLVASGTPEVYPDALLVGLTEPEADGSSGDGKTLSTEWAIGSYR